MLPDNSQHSIASGSFISFSNQEFGRGGFDVDNGWIRVGENSLTMQMPPAAHGMGHALLDGLHATESNSDLGDDHIRRHTRVPSAAYPANPQQQQLAQAYSSAMPVPHVMPGEDDHRSSPVQTAASGPAPAKRGRKAAAADRDTDRLIKGKKIYRCTAEWTDEKTGAVVKCTKTFTTSGHLARHKRLHGGEKPYKCPLDVCNSRFSRHDNMNQHYRAHARKLGIEIVPQTAPSSKNQESDDDPDDDEDEEEEEETPPPSASSRRRRPKAEDQDYRGPAGFDAPQAGSDYYGSPAPNGGYYDQQQAAWGYGD
ncbi:hypothetical protein DFJ74DRAFT_254463 [Hyaloraphidium curvatum]|nr:hypothetical protein DFJ74DRAFT_254463 [Hyaloraphidium curvatum]